MTKMIYPIAISVSLLLGLSACGNEPNSDKTATRLDAVEVEPGTISDAMISLDQIGVDGTAIDNSVPADSSKKTSPAVETADSIDADPSTLATAPDDVVVTPTGPAAPVTRP